MKAIVTGATGFLGGHLVSLLEDSGHQVVALGRDRQKGLTLASASVRFKQADITNPDELQRQFEAADVVFHCAARSSTWGAYDDFYRDNVSGTANVLRCCESLGIARLVHVSSTSVYFNFEHRLNLTESQSLTSGFANHYAKTKYLAEQLLLQEQSRTEVVIIRPRGIVGEGDVSIMPRILRIANRGFFPLINGGQAIVDLTYVKNVAQALLLAAEKPGLNKAIFNISNLEPLTVRELLNRVLERRQRRLWMVPVPYALIAGLSHIFEAVARTLDLEEPILTHYGVGLLARSQTLNVEAACEQLGYRPRYSLDHAIEQYLAWEARHA
jgi:nucleoside-diphosphate-sugar epimerase